MHILICCRKFYENQDKLIAGYEEVHIQKDDKHERSTKLRKKATLYAKVSFAVNVVSFPLKTDL